MSQIDAAADNDNNIEWLLDAAKRELDAYTVQRVLTEFHPVLSEFEAYVQGIVVPDAYRDRLSSFIAFLKRTYEMPPVTVMLAHVNKYSTDIWGPLYWSFLHYASILLQYALHAGYTDDVNEFSLLVYNIDKMLPCGVCVAHYLGVKRHAGIVHLIKMISFGHVVQGTYHFHNVISENVHRHGGGGYATISGRPFRPFTPIDFARRYHCYPLTTSGEKKHISSECGRPGPEWQSPLHLGVCTILVVNYNVSYRLVSDYVKRMYDQRRRNGRPTVYFPVQTVYTEEERRFGHATTIQELYDVLTYSIVTGRPKTRNIDEDEFAKTYIGQAVDEIRAMYSTHGKRLQLSAAAAAADDGDNDAAVK